MALRRRHAHRLAPAVLGVARYPLGVTVCEFHDRHDPNWCWRAAPTISSRPRCPGWPGACGIWRSHWPRGRNGGWARSTCCRRPSGPGWSNGRAPRWPGVATCRPRGGVRATGRARSRGRSPWHGMAARWTTPPWMRVPTGSRIAWWRAGAARDAVVAMALPLGRPRGRDARRGQGRRGQPAARSRCAAGAPGPRCWRTAGPWRCCCQTTPGSAWATSIRVPMVPAWDQALEPPPTPGTAGTGGVGRPGLTCCSPPARQGGPGVMVSHGVLARRLA